MPALAAAPSTAPETFELRDGRTLVGAVSAIRDGRLTIIAAAGSQTVALADLARATRLPFAATGRLVTGVALANGDLVEGAPATLEKGVLKVDSPRFGTIELDIKIVRALFFDRAADSLAARLREPTRAEVLLESNGVTSRTPAELQWVDPARVGVTSPLGPLEISKDDVAWVMLAPTSGAEADSQTDEPAGPTMRVLLTSGESLSGRIVALDAGRLRLCWSGAAGRELTVDWDLVRSIESAGSCLTYVSRLTGRNVRHDSMIGPARPPQADACAAGSPLRLAGRTFEHGVGMRAASRISYTLGGKWQRLRATVGLDDAARASHGATFSVLLDGKSVFTRTLGPGDEPVELDLPVAGARELTLIMDAGPGLDIGDYGDFADARLTR